MGDNPLQLVTCQITERTGGHADGGGRRIGSRRQGVDTGDGLHHPDGRHIESRSDRHFLADIIEPKPRHVRVVRLGKPRPDNPLRADLRHQLIAGSEVEDLIEKSADDGKCGHDETRCDHKRKLFRE